MGKKQHQSDKLYVTATEWSTLYGGKRKRSANDPDFKDFRRLPIDHCALRSNTLYFLAASECMTVHSVSVYKKHY